MPFILMSFIIPFKDLNEVKVFIFAPFVLSQWAYLKFVQTEENFFVVEEMRSGEAHKIK